MKTVCLVLSPDSHLRLSAENLRWFGVQLRTAGLDALQWTDGISTMVLAHFLGQQWMEQYFDIDGKLKKRPDLPDARGPLQASMRACELAEMLYNLQDAPGFEGVHKRLRRGDFEGTSGELIAGRFLKAHGEEFRFVEPVMKLGEDFDIEILRKDGNIPCEVKSKLSAAHLTSRGIYTSLEHARKQLPRHSPGIIFLRAASFRPANEFESIINLVEPAARKLFRQTKRIIAVVFLVETFWHLKDCLTSATLAKTIENGGTGYPPALVSNLKRYGDSWIRFSSLLGLIEVPPVPAPLEDWAKCLREELP